MDFRSGGWLIGGRPTGLLIRGDHLFLNYLFFFGQWWLINREGFINPHLALLHLHFSILHQLQCALGVITQDSDELRSPFFRCEAIAKRRNHRNLHTPLQPRSSGHTKPESQNPGTVSYISYTGKQRTVCVCAMCLLMSYTARRWEIGWNCQLGWSFSAWASHQSHKKYLQSMEWTFLETRPMWNSAKLQGFAPGFWFSHICWRWIPGNEIQLKFTFSNAELFGFFGPFTVFPPQHLISFVANHLESDAESYWIKIIWNPCHHLSKSHMKIYMTSQITYILIYIEILK